MKKIRLSIKLSSNRTRSIPEWKEQQELLRELRDLLDAYGPAWYTEKLATRLNKMVGKSASSKN
jgi:hypothetical protein